MSKIIIILNDIPMIKYSILMTTGGNGNEIICELFVVKFRQILCSFVCKHKE